MIENPCKKCDDPAMGCANTCGDLAEYRYIEKLEKELKQAKELLKAANKDIFDMLTERFGTLCEFCKWYNKSDAECASPRNGSGGCCCEYGGWRREGEALALIKDGST